MKTNFLITAILLLTANVLTTRAEQRKNCIDVAVFSINDFHAAFVSNPDKGIAGAANLVHTLDSLKQLYPYHVTVSAGDNFGGSYFYNATRSRSLLPQLLTDLDIRISAIGNHEFDEGQDALADKWHQVFIRPYGWDIDYVSANIRNRQGRIPAFTRPWQLTSISLPNGKELKVAFIGLTTSNTPRQASVRRLAGLSFDGRYAAVLDSIATLPDYAPVSHAHLRILLTHIGTYMKNGKPAWDDCDSLQLAAIHRNDLQGILTSHTHQPVCGHINAENYPVVQAGCYGNYIGMLKYTVDTTSMRIVCAEPRLVAVKAPQRLSPKARRLQAQIDELLATTLTPGGTPIGTRLTVARKNIVHNRDNRYRQTSIGQWVCTAFANSFRQAAGMNNDTAIIGVSHIGSIRTGFAKGSVSVIDVGEVLPFANPLRVYRLNGSQLKELVRFGLSNLQYGYMQMAGVEVEKDRKGQVDALFYVSPDGKRKKIGAKDYCYLVADEFMTNGGDGYAPELFPASQEVKDVVLPSTTDAFINFLKTVPYLDE